jgi:serine/threonine protein phosphatase 1
MATFAVGDIHGQLAPLVELLATMAPEIATGDTVVFLGDYIDRGLHSKAVVETILAFAASTPATVVSLLGNHEEWMLRTMRDSTDHSWLLGMDGLTTIASYSAEAAETIAAAARANRGALYDGSVALPYGQFFDAMPTAHRDFFATLRRCHETADCLCSHGGLDPRVDSQADQGRALVWGGPGFPERYSGSRPVVYGHHNDAAIDADDWPHARVMGVTYGLDTIAHGVLTAIRLPGPRFYQSGRYERRHEIEGEE